MYRRVIGFGSFALDVGASRRDDLDWLVEFLTPQFSLAPRQRADWTVRLRTDSAAFKGLRQRLNGGDAPGEEAAFALDTQTVYLPRLGRWLFDRDFEVAYHISGKRRHVEIVKPSYNRWNARVSLMRVIRELSMTHAESLGGVLIHGAAYLVNGRAVAIAGAKGSGKTTSLVQALSERGVRYISNDRLLVTAHRGRLTCRGIPTIVTLRRSMVAGLPALAERLSASRYVCFLTRDEARSGRIVPDQIVDNEGRFSLSPPQLCDLLGVGGAPGGTLAAIVFPLITGQPGTTRLTRLAGADAAQHIRRGLFRANLDRIARRAFDASGHRQAPPGELAGALPERVRCYVLELGLDAASDSSWVSRAADLVEGGRGTRGPKVRRAH